MYVCIITYFYNLTECYVILFLYLEINLKDLEQETEMETIILK